MVIRRRQVPGTGQVVSLERGEVERLGELRHLEARVDRARGGRQERRQQEVLVDLRAVRVELVAEFLREQR